MNKETIATGKTVEEAIDKARRELGAAAEETSFEILELPRRGFLGLRHMPAKVRVYVLQEEEPSLEKAPKEPEPAARTEMKKTADKPRTPAAAQKTRAEGPGTDKTAPLAEKTGKKKEIALPHAMDPEQKKAVATAEKPEQTDASQSDMTEKARTAQAYVRDVLTAMGVKDARVLVKETSDNIEIYLEGADLGVVIGRRGETLDAVQYLTSLVANRLDGSYVRVSIDSGDYRKKRAETLERLAFKLARSAVKTGKSTKLEPMNPYERRIIHAAVSKVEGATSSSIGEEPNRRVVISSKTARRKPDGPREREIAPRSGRQMRRGADRPARDERADRPRRPPSTEQSAHIHDAEIEIPDDLAPKALPEAAPAPHPVKTVTKTSTDEKGDLPLYGKIDV